MTSRSFPPIPDVPTWWVGVMRWREMWDLAVSIRRCNFYGTNKLPDWSSGQLSANSPHQV